MKGTDLWNFIHKTISSDKKVVLLTVAESSNSSPGRQGFKMAVSEDAEMIGTIGGGIMEKDKLLFIVEGDRATLIPLLQRPITELFGARPANRSYPGHQAIRDAIHAELGERVARGEE